MEFVFLRFVPAHDGHETTDSSRKRNRGWKRKKKKKGGKRIGRNRASPPVPAGRARPFRRCGRNRWVLQRSPRYKKRKEGRGKKRGVLEPRNPLCGLLVLGRHTVHGKREVGQYKVRKGDGKEGRRGKEVVRRHVPTKTSDILLHEAQVYARRNVRRRREEGSRTALFVALVCSS